MVYLITGCLGFIGHHYTQRVLDHGHNVIGLDAKTYAANPERKQHMLRRAGKFRFIEGDIATITELPDVDVIINFAAETHVDNSIVNATKFTHSNLVGVQNLLDLIRNTRPDARPHFVHISTDEVYGDVPYPYGASETDNFHPSNPYAASKAAADLYITAYARTYGLTYNIIRPSNCWGIGQYREKLIPKAMIHFLLGRPLHIHGDGTQVRSWLHVSDAAAAVDAVVNMGTKNEVYNIGGITMDINAVVDLVKTTYTNFFELPDLHPTQIRHNGIRPGMDLSYGVNDAKLRADCDWAPTHTTMDDAQLKQILCDIVRIPIINYL